VDGTDVAGPIRTREVSNAVSAVASVPEVRRHLVAMQQEIIADALAAGAGIVAEGRDIGTAVAPDAPVKVFLTASETVRARRRAADLATDPTATVELTRAEQARRDRSDAPQMAKAADAVEIDTTALGLDEVIREIVALAQAAPQAHQGSAGSRGRPLQTPRDGAGSGGRPPQTPPDSAGSGGRPPQIPPDGAGPGQNPPLRKAGAWST
jgi:cytidylate kinase